MVEEVRDIPLGDLVIGKGQVRVRDVGKDIDELAASIAKLGQLEPIVVCPAETPGKYEILTGQRRFLACRELQKETIKAVIREKVDDTMAKVISVTENVVRRDLHNSDLIDACTELYHKYGSIAAVAEETGLKQQVVRQYVKFDQLSDPLKDLVRNNEVSLKAALKAQQAVDRTEDKDPDEAVKLAKELSQMSGAQQKKVTELVEQKPDVPVDDVIEEAKSSKVTQVIVTLTDNLHRSLQSFAQEEGTTQDEAASGLIEEGLSSKGFMEA